MLPKVSLLDELRRGGYEASLIATFNAYLPFYEEVVLRRLQNAGVRNNVLLMDARQYGISIETHPPRLAGRHYTLLPVRVGAAFHPKVILLVGKQKAAVLVGSHNVTLAGFGFNRELTNLITAKDERDAQARSVARSVWQEVQHWVTNLVEAPRNAKEVIRRIVETAPWLDEPATPSAELSVLAGRPGGTPLWEQIKRELGSAVTSVTVAGAFFDKELEFLRTVRRDYKQAKVTVAVDPATVVLSPLAKALKGVAFVRGDRLGEEDGAGTGRRYLHAKSIYLRGKSGVAAFATGSANPSAPAWLRSDVSANVELMVAQFGKAAVDTAKILGFADLEGGEPLIARDWQQVGANVTNEADGAAPSHRFGVAVAEAGGISVDSRLLRGLNVRRVLLRLRDTAEQVQAEPPVLDGEQAFIDCDEAIVPKTSMVELWGAKGIIAQCLVHHVREVEEHSRTGTQRKFRDALQSLHTDSPNIELLIHCIDKIVFTPERAEEIRPRRPADTKPDAAEEPDTLAIDVADVKKRGRKHRLRHASDFGYLLDTLIYHLRVQDDRIIEEQDLFGRNEEEQVGKDDDERKERPRMTVEEQVALLQLCHRKVATVISRMIAQMEAYHDGQQTLFDVLVRLLAVLAVLRELRSCDGRVAWVQKGQTTVPEEERLRLLDETVLNLFERNPRDKNSSMLNLEPLGEDFKMSDDVARLKGLILWLGWDCGLTFDAHAPFNESREERDERLRNNAIILALAQMIQSEEVVIDEARRSIGSLTSSELTWLEGIKNLDALCHENARDPSVLEPAETAEPGDIAVHKGLKQWDLRVVASNDGNRISLIRLDSYDETMGYRPDHLSVFRM
jgi:hypothetical protein